jgi:hypothetical protein
MVYNTLPINSASYINASFHNSTSHVTNNYGKINEISVRYSSVNAHDSASYVANNYRWTHKILAMYERLMLMIQLHMSPKFVLI